MKVVRKTRGVNLKQEARMPADPLHYEMRPPFSLECIVYEIVFINIQMGRQQIFIMGDQNRDVKLSQCIRKSNHLGIVLQFARIYINPFKPSYGWVSLYRDSL